MSETEFNFDIECAPEFSLLNVKIPEGKTLRVEASAMAAMDTNLKMKSKLKGGFGRILTGESLFINEYTAQKGEGSISIAPGAPGDIRHIHLDGNTVFLQNSSFVACGTEVTLETKWQGMTRGFFSGESFFLIKCSGKGDLWYNSYGAIFEIDVKGYYTVDTGHIVGFTDGLEYRVRPVGGFKSLFLSGEGLVCEFSGNGTVWIQTRQVPSFTGWLHPFRRVKRKVQT